MSSTPPVEASSPTKSTPPSSPPSAATMSEPEKDTSGAIGIAPSKLEPAISAQMLEEEGQLKKNAERDASEDQRRASQWASADRSEQKSQFGKLMRLVEQSKVFASIMQQRMQQEEEKRQQKTEAERRKMEKQEEKAEEVAKGQMRKGTRASLASESGGKEEAKEDGKKTLPVRGRGRPKKGEKQDGSISSWLQKDEIDKKTGGMSVSQAVAEAAEEYEGEKSGAFGAQNLRSANQPEAVSGGVMRAYQLEGLYWLRSLYENGLNGILGE